MEEMGRKGPSQIARGAVDNSSRSCDPDIGRNTQAGVPLKKRSADCTVKSFALKFGALSTE
jgi:hypothetical protein